MLSCTDYAGNNNNPGRADSLQYKIKTISKTWNHCSPDSAGCTYIQFFYPEFANLEGPLTDSIQKIKAEAFDAKTGTDPDLDSVQISFIREFEEVSKEEESSKLPWNLLTSLTVQGQNSAWICLDESSGGYTGGAHDFGHSQYHILEKATGRHLHLADFFDSTGLQKLTRIGETAFCLERGIKSNQSLTDAGFNFENDRFFMPENFCFTANGLTFIFNSYEVGPYALGPTEFSIPANQLVSLMKKRKD
jgi:hypothetical protein